MKKKFYFKNQSLTIKGSTYCKPPTWIPPEPNSTSLTLFLDQIHDPLYKHHQHTRRSNLTSQQRSTLRNIGSNPDLLIKYFGKGNKICLMDTFFYINKIEEQQAGPTTYKELNTDPTQAIMNDAFSTRQYLTPPEPACTPFFYGLLKVHKPNIPLQPIISAWDSPSNQISNYVTHFIQPLVKTLPSYICNSRHYLSHSHFCLRTPSW